MWLQTLVPWLLFPVLSLAQCPIYTSYSAQQHEPLSGGKYNLSSMRPVPACRTFYSHEVEETIERLRGVIKDPDLFRLFENAWPSTLDTTVAWRGWSNSSLTSAGKGKVEEEELTFIITGDIEAMWLRDSANQLQAYTSILTPNASTESLASLFRGAITLQARYILGDPFCNAFQAPLESGVAARSSANSDQITPKYDYFKVFSCQWELDSVASFLQLSADYFAATGDIEFFRRSGNWTRAVEMVLDTAESMMVGSYDEEGRWVHTNYTYCAPYGGTPINACNGSPHRGSIGLIRSFHRPSDDACIYQYLIPSNMMFSSALNASSFIAEALHPHAHSPLTARMRHIATGINAGINAHAIVSDSAFGKVYAYEIDGYGSHIVMDDPNVPSLLSAPFIHYTTSHDPIYRNTRRKILSPSNPYFSRGPIISGVGSMHTLPGKVWPMANIMTILTSEDDDEIIQNLQMVLGSTAGTGLVHESVDSWDEGRYSRSWFSWANGLFGQCILELERSRPWILGMSFQ